MIWLPGTSFEHRYICYPASFIEKPYDTLHIDYPMLFELRNAAAERASHCGVLEFIAQEGMIYMPYWVGYASFGLYMLHISSIVMMENLLLQEGDIVGVKNVTLPKGTYVKLQPHTKDFLDISNPKAILETTLRNYSCLTTGDSIMVAYNNKKYYVYIIDTKPSNAISIIETDCEVDFAPPLDFKEPERPAVPISSKAKSQEAPAEAEPKFCAFTGTGRRLDWKPLKQPSSPVFSTRMKDKGPSVSNGNSRQSSSGASSQSSTHQAQGKLVFGSNVNRPKETKQEPGKQTKQVQPEKKEDPNFQAFTRRKYSLKDAYSRRVFSGAHSRAQITYLEPGKQTKQVQPEKKEDPNFQAFTRRKYSLKG
ncbi:Detected protein of confused Function [Hibiscus syriacus]|uniref:Detected protein of confused Function n=1 Tax=Hibiscus syriacus TaxID=106335 RepID=A0A6A3B026_HIBSY|nr:Detected protein of confused Function [Hibiscus syriacus]